jgi:hypothetical protein
MPSFRRALEAARLIMKNLSKTSFIDVDMTKVGKVGEVFEQLAQS